MEEPILPPELEHYIFELAALAHGAVIPALLRVAQRVLAWMEPMLYNVLRLDDAAELLVTKAIRRALKSKPPRFFHDCVRHIVLQDASYWSPEKIDELFYRCTGLVGFASANSHCTPRLLPVFSKLHARYFSLMLTDLFLGLPIDLVHPMFLSVTHLDLLAHHTSRNWLDITVQESRHFSLLPD
ncbi:hypothetical protein C8J57DRAFT_1501012 [Mycena rebaudengoi]|nr:hypothetical protein C8J57DRAFT_1501012 [Mycena rebaudengoi]